MKNIMKLSAVLCTVLFVTQLPSVAMGINFTWTNGNGDQDWFNADNWDDGAGNPGNPTGAHEAHINAAAPAAIVDGVGTVGRVVMENDGVLDITANGNLDVRNDQGSNGQFLTANASTSLNSLVNVDGQLTVANVFAIGNSQGAGKMTVGATGVVNANGDWFIGGHDAGADGTITVNGGTINVAAFMALGWNGTGTLNMNGGLVDVTGVMNLGVNNAISNGDIIINAGEVASAGLNMGNNVGSGSLLMEDGAKYTNNGGFVQSPGSKVTINGSAEFIFTTSELADVETLINGNPDWVFSGTSSITGSLGSVIVTNAGLGGVLGDFNDDGIVNAADYTVWLDNLGSSFDLNGNGEETGGSAGTVDQADYDLWKVSFGNISGAVTSSSVPEPSTALLAMFAIGAICALRRRMNN